MPRSIKILIVDDKGSVLEKLDGRIKIFWPEDVPVKATPIYCAWADETIEAIQEYQPDILLLNYKYIRDEKTGKDVALWIDQNYWKPIYVAAHSDLPEEEMREHFKGTRCIRYFISGDGIKAFIENAVLPQLTQSRPKTD